MALTGLLLENAGLPLKKLRIRVSHHPASTTLYRRYDNGRFGQHRLLAPETLVWSYKRMSLPCLMDAWAAHEGELLGYLRHHSGHADDAEELLQELFIKALRQGNKFCSLANPRAWLFQVARNLLTDKYRLRRETLPLDEELPQPEAEAPLPVDTLSQCLPRVLSELSAPDRQALLLCDIEGRSQQALAEQLGISLSGAKSRLQRARLRLRRQLEVRCKVRFDEHGAVCCFTPRSAH